MLVVHVIRKPLSEGNVASNVLRWGTGAINIDASRISTSPEDREEMLKMSRGFVGKKMGRPEMVNYGYEDSMPIKTLSVPSSEGRWPANLIFEHKAGCQKVGMHKIKGSHDTTGVWGKGGSKNVYSKWGNAGVQQGYVGADGTETIPKWACAPGCPVAELDKQTGILTTNPGTYRKSGREGEGSTYALDSQEGRVLSKGGSGGASRYFKQIQEDPE